ncbi:hypothetical protein [Mycobacteroides immunogenum]|uniref:Uncharacterized protein n=1 Tax=Mycobacteroides immunogenum TaxID=83262 RepID=A0A7V8RXD3_9MYCO|nr:hypothetical protein [Mycobacteroides immunogenum]KPG14365.1 hypothetical protein AN908_07385 [Mycobacteroides immunogenum]KPG24054.1 hypothetical protein AN911_00910 [Mycobacteroides immunogenum]KPG55822.1 hypothetical protein AN916_08275 [Mycobacteroides immunogenum]
MAGIGFASVDTDVSSLVNAAFDELECPMDDEYGHSGDRTAFVTVHGCVEGYVCRNHFDRLTGPFPENFREMLMVCGHVSCGVCGGRFTSIDQWMKVYPL